MFMMLAHAVRSAPRPASAPTRSPEAATAIRPGLPAPAVAGPVGPGALDDHRWLHGDYDGHGKSGVQEACESARALGIALIASAALSAATAVAVIASL